MEGIAEIEALELSGEDATRDENLALNDVLQPLSPRSSLVAIKRQEEVRNDFADFIQANNQCNSEIAACKNSIPPILRSNSVVRNLENSFKHANQNVNKVSITMDDIEDEIHFRKPSIVCYVLGVNPPLHILDGFVHRIWQGKVDRVKMLSYGIFIIRFHSLEDRDQILNGGYIFFNRRPVIMKPWDPNENYKKEDVQKVPIWVQLEELELKYWGQKSLFKIVAQVGNPIMVDSVTRERERLSYPRILVEVQMDQKLPDLLEFENEFGLNTSVYEEGFTKVHSKKGSAIRDDAENKGSGSGSGKTNSTEVKNSFQNVCGANSQHKQQMIKQFINSQKVDFVGLLETRVKAPKLGALYLNVFVNWYFSSNIAWHAGGKIVIAWNPDRFTVDILKSTSQLMHLKLRTTEGFNSLLTVFYASNNRAERKVLWKDLCELKTNENWLLMGDFNDILAKEERIGHRIKTHPDTKFLQCVNTCQVEDVKASGNFFT
uniref:DUF4283 domain-containing protein n=1 Tax=Cannabis sativa TaxID=3483 RepID=A0A803Q8A9_CANSA